ncbi:hypothetical protein GO988_21860 [Hymenobacter sp. HMF4947]|uniref:Glycosyl transferase family 1 domain-containing protein n=1 Tax=Hymenobacter ginkgonis TaxID=2682976 RepID=A0A7K1TKQ0_9BACT|nr:hypothetical protein [Hymenobacter ginkgonis]MVN78985.1 hypothetical protein [Hymenobacter ginkgonis]
MINLKDKTILLEQSKIIYETCIDIMANNFSVKDAEKALARISFLGTLAWSIHPGKFYDPRLERWALNIGKSIWETASKDESTELRKVSSRKVVHVATETYEVGGHTRFLLNIIKEDINSAHFIILTSQYEKDMPNWLRTEVSKSGGEVISLANKTRVEKVASLQSILTSYADKVFYHIHPNDSIPIAALAATPRPQVITINHADHVFWLGSVLSDIVACYRVLSLDSVMVKRGAQRAMLLPIPLSFPPFEWKSKNIARKELGIKDDDLLILTVASSNKFIPSGQYNYYLTIKQVLDKNPNVFVKVIGLSVNDDLRKHGFEINDRVELLGHITNPKLYYEAADIYLDSMPLSSYTSLLEAMYFGCFPVLPFSPVGALNVENEPSLKGLVKHPATEAQQIQFMQEAIDDLNFRKEIATKGNALIQDNYIGEGWKKYLLEIYKESFAKIDLFPKLEITTGESAIFTQDDEDAILLANSSGSSIDKLFTWLNVYLEIYTIFDLFKLLYLLRRNLNVISLTLPLSQVMRLVKTKLLSIR